MVNINKIYIGCVLLSLLSFYFCRVKKETDYEFPEQMLSHVKEHYKVICERGKILWTMNCASCHNIKKGGKFLIPDFSEAQLRGYELRIANAKHENALPDSLVSEEDLSVIMDFLRYKKKNLQNKKN